MITKQPSLINPREQSLLNQSASSSSIKSNRKFLVFCAFLLTLLLGSSLQRASSYLPTYDRRAYQRAFVGRRFFSAGKVSQVREIVHEVRRPEPAYIDREDALYCDRSHYRTELCVARGDVRVLGGTAHAASSYRVLVLAEQGPERIEKLKPYTRKWETSVMKTIDEVMVIKKVLRSSGLQNTNQRPLHPSGGQYWTWRSFLPQKKEGMKRLNHSANMAVVAQNMEPRKRNPSTHGHKTGLQVRPDDSSGDIREEQQGFQQLESGSFVRGNQSSIQHKRAPAAHRIRKAVMQRRPAAIDVGNDHSFACEVQHAVPAILFSTGGYTGNVYHEFNDGFIPLFITAQQYPPGQVVLVVLEYHDWWMSKYQEFVAQISNYTVIDLARDKRVHCFPEVTVGLRIHDELAIHAENPDHASMEGFQAILQAAYVPRLYEKAKSPAAVARPVAVSTQTANKRRKLVLISRSSPRALLNEQEVIELAEEIGFIVQVLKPTPLTRVAEIYKALSRCDVMVGVHGAAMTHLLFMRRGATFIQVVPLGTDWAAATYYGEPAQKLGLNYVAYKVSPMESSLWHKYSKDDPVLVSPESVNEKGWGETKRIYLEAQDVTLSLPRLRETLRSAYGRAITSAS